MDQVYKIVIYDPEGDVFRVFDNTATQRERAKDIVRSLNQYLSKIDPVNWVDHCFKLVIRKDGMY